MITGNQEIINNMREKKLCKMFISNPGPGWKAVKQILVFRVLSWWEICINFYSVE